MSAFDPAEDVGYDELQFLGEICDELGLRGPLPTVRRVFLATADGRRLSGLVWGDRPPELVLLHGGGQNAHTWDAVLLALGRPALALDLPGHGLSDDGRDGDTGFRSSAPDVADAMRRLAPDARCVIGMSHGAMITLVLLQTDPDLVPAAVLVDATPGIERARARAARRPRSRPVTFASYEELAEHARRINPNRPEAALRRSVRHNAYQRPDGRWQWRHERFGRGSGPPDGDPRWFDRFLPLWDAVAQARVPLLLARGMTEGSNVSDDDEAMFLRLCPTARVRRFERAGHSVQSDMPLELAAAIEAFLAEIAEAEPAAG